MWSVLGENVQGNPICWASGGSPLAALQHGREAEKGTAMLKGLSKWDALLYNNSLLQELMHPVRWALMPFEGGTLMTYTLTLSPSHWGPSSST